MFFQFLTVPRAQLIAHLVDGEVRRILEPGRHFVWTWPFWVHEFFRYLEGDSVLEVPFDEAPRASPSWQNSSRASPVSGGDFARRVSLREAAGD